MALTNSQYDAIMREYNRKQAKDRYEQEQRIKEVYGAIGQMEDLEKEISSLAVSQARKLLEGEKQALTALREKLADLREQKQVLLAAAGFPADYMEMRYHCPDCRDTGYVGREKCHCFRQTEIDFLYTQSNLKEVLERENFSRFCLDYYGDRADYPGRQLSPRENILRVMKSCRDLVEHADQFPVNILFTGPAGVGKTYLTHCIAKEMLDRYRSVIYLTSNDLFDTLSKSKFEYKPDADSTCMHQHILDCDMLIIDDLGTELNNTFTTSQLFYCLNERAAAKSSTVISTNLSIAAMTESYSERVTSRLLSSYKIWEIYGEDIRIKKLLREKT